MDWVTRRVSGSAQTGRELQCPHKRRKKSERERVEQETGTNKRRGNEGLFDRKKDSPTQLLSRGLQAILFTIA